MKNSPMLPVRHPERGAVAMLVAFMWTALFGMAVLAVDFGYLYTKRRGAQAVADSAVRAAMPIYQSTGFSAATTRAQAVATANHYSLSEIQTDQPVAGSQFRVRISRTYPTFFGSLFGLNSKAVTGTAVGQLPAVAAGGASIYSSDPGCSPQFTGSVGINIGGQGRLVVNGDVATAGNKIEVASWDPSCTPATCKITGAVNSACNVYNDSPANLGVPANGSGVVADPLQPLIATLGAACTVGTLGADLSAAGGLPWSYNAAGNCNELLPAGQVYCSSTLIAVSPPTSPNICATGTFISAAGVVINADGNINLLPAPTAPMAGSTRLLAYAGTAGVGCAVPAMNVSNGPAPSTFTLGGALYAPNGCMNISSNTMTFTANGTVDGKMVAISMGPGMLWTFNGSGGGGGGGPSGWTIVQ